MPVIACNNINCEWFQYPTKMKIRLYLLVCFILLHVAVDAQMKIGDNCASLLELETTNKGLVFPRVSLTSVSSSLPLDAILLTGTVVFNTNASVRMATEQCRE